MSTTAIMSAPSSTNPSNTLISNKIKSAHETNGARYFKNPTPEMLVQAEEKDERIVGMIFAESSGKRGKFLVPQRIKLSQFLTETKEIDFSLADFAVPVTTIYVKDFLGGIDLIVPPGVRVETQTVGFWSGIKHSKAVVDCTTTDNENGPLIIVKWALLASDINVKVNRRVPPIAIMQ